MQRLPPGLYDIAKRLRTRFKCDGRRKLYDRPTADGPLSRYYKSFRFSASSERQPRRRSFPPKSLLPIANRTRRPLLPPVKFPIAKRLRHKHSRFFFSCISLFSSVFPLSFLFYLFIYFFFLFVSREKAKFQTLFSFHIATIANPTEISILLCVADSETQPLWYFLRASVNVARVQWRVHGSREQLFRVCWKSDRNLRPATRVTVTSRMYSVISCLVNSCLDVAVLHASYLVASLNVTSESVSCWLGD